MLPTAKHSTIYSKDQLNRSSRQASSWGEFRAFNQRDNSFNTAKSIGTLRASSSPVQFGFKGGLNKRDRVDFFKLTIAPGAAFTSTRNQSNLRGGNVQITTYVEIAGGPRQRVDVSRFSPGKTSEEFNSPFSNSVGLSIQLVFEVRTLSPARKINYQSTLTFTP